MFVSDCETLCSWFCIRVMWHNLSTDKQCKSDGNGACSVISCKCNNTNVIYHYTLLSACVQPCIELEHIYSSLCDNDLCAL